MGSFSVRLRTRALRDVRQIRNWYRKIDPTVEERFVLSLNEGLDKIEQRPFSYQIIHRNTRRVILVKFPYSIFYVIQDSRVIVIAIIHHKKNPELAKGIAE